MSRQTQLPNAAQAQQPMQGSQQLQRSQQMGQGQQVGSQMDQQVSGQTGQQVSGQMDQQVGAQMGQQMGMRLQDVQTPQQRQALQDVGEAIKVCAFCADQCVQEANPNMVECIRLCEDVTELGATALELVPRQSRQSRPVLQALGQAMQACGQECGRHSHAHCRDCASVLSEAVQSVQQLEQSFVQ